MHRNVICNVTSPEVPSLARALLLSLDEIKSTIYADILSGCCLFMIKASKVREFEWIHVILENFRVA